jgi:hypothetical protein
MRGTLRLGASALLALVVCGVAGGPVAAPAHAADTEPYAASAATRYQVTLAARSCGAYRDVAAGQIRDDTDEAADRPGRNTPYQPGQAVDPDVEDNVDAGCTDLAGWRFTFGSGHTRKGDLSTVTGVSSTTPPTKESGDRLDTVGKNTGGLLGGAVTVTLTDEEVRLAARRQLWVQGGSPDQPVQSGYGFGALRCAVDGRTGGNIQWVTFPAGVRHVFCYAYYVKGPVETGTITVRMRPSRPVGYPQRVAFQSDLSRSGDGSFNLSSSNDAVEASFARPAGSHPYTVRAQPPDGWRVSGLTCAATKGSSATTDVATGASVVVLAPRDQVTCEYTLEPPAAPPGLTLRVFTAGAAAPFQVTVAGKTLTTTTGADPGAAAPATGADLTGLPAGSYPVIVNSTATGWSLAGAVCNGAPIQASAKTVPVSLAAGVPLDCTLRVAFTPPTPQLKVVTRGGVAGAGFALAPASGGTGWWAAANTAKADAAAVASGDVPREVDSGIYLVTAIPPRSDLTGGWKLSSFSCDPTERNPVTGALARVALTPGGPDPVCTATYQFEPSTVLLVTLRGTGAPAGRAEPAVLEVSCVDGSSGRVVLDAGSADDGLPQPLAFLEPTSCTITQPATGAARTSEVKTTAAFDPPDSDGGASLPAQVDVVRTVAKYTVAVTDHFGQPADDGRQTSILDELAAHPAVLVGIGIFTLGALIFMGVLLRRRMVT